MNCNSGIWRASLNELNEVADGRRTTVESFGYGVARRHVERQGVGSTLAGWKMHDGSLWFPTTNGVVVVDPRRHDTEPPRVVIEGVDGRSRAEPVARPDPNRSRAREPGNPYTGLSWRRPREIKFRFCMAGLDREWVDAGARRTAYYSHLPPGDYTFTVIADNGEGVWNTTGQSSLSKSCRRSTRRGGFLPSQYPPSRDSSGSRRSVGLPSSSGRRSRSRRFRAG